MCLDHVLYSLIKTIFFLSACAFLIFCLEVYFNCIKMSTFVCMLLEIKSSNLKFSGLREITLLNMS